MINFSSFLFEISFYIFGLLLMQILLMLGRISFDCILCNRVEHCLSHNLFLSLLDLCRLRLLLLFHTFFRVYNILGLARYCNKRSYGRLLQ